MDHTFRDKNPKVASMSTSLRPRQAKGRHLPPNSRLPATDRRRFNQRWRRWLCEAVEVISCQGFCASPPFASGFFPERELASPAFAVFE
ncbi:hypothetical protein U1Q18_042554 [Sarracenia purpurea var. burkii]